MSPKEEGGMKEARDEDNNIIIGDAALQNILTPQLKTLPHNTKSCVSLSVAYLPKSCIRNYYHGVSFYFLA